MKEYSYLIFDVDDTLLDFGAAFYQAQRDMAELLGMEYSPEYAAAAEECGYRAWRESGMERTADPDVQSRYHEYYFDYVKKQCINLAERFCSSVGHETLTDRYISSISSSRIFMEENTVDTIRRLSERYAIVLATNGLERIQRPRIVDFLPYTQKVFISESVGAIKPSKEFFDCMLAELGCRAEDCLMIGDSLSNDILGAKVAGMKTCWYNVKNKPLPENCAADYVITGIAQLADMLL